MQASLSFSGTLTPVNEITKKKRKSYTRQEKLRVISFYKEHNLYQTCEHFELNSKTVLRWVRDKKNITKSKRGSKSV